MKKYNKILEDHGDWLLVDISTPKFPDAKMAVDKDVWDKYDGYRVFARMAKHNKYIKAAISRAGDLKSVLFHRNIMTEAGENQIDHIKHGSVNFIDNRRSNLRVVTSSQNSMNKGVKSTSKTGITGVFWHKASKSWCAHISINRRAVYLGIFDNIEIAIGVRQQAEREHYGEYAYKAEGEKK